MELRRPNCHNLLNTVKGKMHMHFVFIVLRDKIIFPLVVGPF